MNQNYEEDNRDIITLTLDDNSEMDCVVLTTFTVAGKDYMALLPTEGIEAEEGTVWLYSYTVGKDGNPDLVNIESDEEYEAVSDAFDEWLDSQEYDELVGEDDFDDLEDPEA